MDSVKHTPISYEEYCKNWWKSHKENKHNMTLFIMNLLQEHCGEDEGMYMDLQENFYRMFDSGPEPKGIHEDTLQIGNGEDVHFHKSIGNKLLCTENHWGAYSMYRVHKLINISCPLLWVEE